MPFGDADEEVQQGSGEAKIDEAGDGSAELVDTVDNGGDASDAIEIELGRANTGSDSAGECEVVFSTLDGEDGKEATVFGVAG